MRLICFALLLFCTTTLLAQKTKEEVLQQLDKNTDTFEEAAMQIWDWAEVGYQEEKSSALLQFILKEEGFTIENGVAGIPTAFVATYGKGEPTIAILAEYDALPGVSQKAIPTQEAVVPEAAGHACGHHLFGAGSVAAAIALKDWLKANKSQGTIKLMGCPAEEGGAGKVYLVREGLFDDVDITLHWHPSSTNGVVPEAKSLANKSAKFRFYGQPAHAAGSPHRGRSALDGVEAMNYMVNLMREHVPEKTRIHYVITKGGDAPNVVPGFAEVYYYVRHPEMEQVKSIFERVVQAAEGAAKGTDTRMEYEVIHGIYNMMPNRTLAEVMYNNLKLVGGVEYTAEEKEFAMKLMESYDTENSVEDAAEIQPFVNFRKGGGSTDVGDVSWMVPTTGMRAATWVPGCPGHSWQAVASGGTSIGTKGMMVAAKTIALTGIDIFSDPEIVEKATQEFYERRGKDFEYESLLGDRKPPLDYRK